MTRPPVKPRYRVSSESPGTAPAVLPAVEAESTHTLCHPTVRRLSVPLDSVPVPMPVTVSF